MYGIKNIIACMKYITPFCDDFDLDLYGYHLKYRGNKLLIKSKFTNFKHSDKIAKITDIKRDIVVFSNSYMAAYIAELLPNAKIYVPVDKLIFLAPIEFEGYKYEPEIEIEKKYKNIIFSLPPKKYWPTV